MKVERAVGLLISSMKHQGIVGSDDEEVVEQVKHYLTWAYQVGYEAGYKDRNMEHAHNRRAVRQLDRWGNLIKVHDSVEEAATAAQCSRTTIYASIKHNRLTRQKYYWRYIDDGKDQDNG